MTIGAFILTKCMVGFSNLVVEYEYDLFALYGKLCPVANFQYIFNNLFIPGNEKQIRQLSSQMINHFASNTHPNLGTV